MFADRQQCRAALGIGNRICILSFGGSLGARRVNEAIADVMAHFAGGDTLHFIHATGQYGVELFPELLSERGIAANGNPHIDIREFIHNMPECLAAADLVICRAGAISCSELQAAGRASVLIPSPNVAENHQYHNAMVLHENRAAMVIEEKALTADNLLATVKDLTGSSDTLKALGDNARKMAILDANQRIYDEMMALYQSKR